MKYSNLEKLSDDEALRKVLLDEYVVPWNKMLEDPMQWQEVKKQYDTLKKKLKPKLAFCPKTTALLDESAELLQLSSPKKTLQYRS